ncbi:hypothetical protein BH10PAT2_BH10PAT2_2280 [soil metagenome]
MAFRMERGQIVFKTESSEVAEEVALFPQQVIDLLTPFYDEIADDPSVLTESEYLALLPDPKFLPMVQSYFKIAIHEASIDYGAPIDDSITETDLVAFGYISGLLWHARRNSVRTRGTDQTETADTDQDVL